ncbi:MAG TPA: TIGR04552 family protein [Kofleriaceae bacterium]|nr:TIGR04552 family protein [Kofleriaceae bacterium]
MAPATVLPRVVRSPTVDDIDLDDLEAVRLLLRGDSVVDWHRLAFHDEAAVDRFLRLCELDPGSDVEMARLEAVRQDAVDYLTRVYHLALPDEVADDVAARDLFLIASRSGPHQRAACVVLKVMHIIYHLAGRQALLRLAVSDDAIFREVELKVVRVVEELRAAGSAVAEFEWSRKPRDSQITKLLAKRSTLAANIYDKLRFRLIVPTFDDLVPTLATLTRQLIPFNYVVPGESVNQLLDLESVIEGQPKLSRVAGGLQPHEADRRRQPHNEFSGPEYRIINFVADLPLRIERLVPNAELGPDDSHVVFVLTEFQVADKATALANESGACSHEAYKARQHERVRIRLLREEDDPVLPD